MDLRERDPLDRELEQLGILTASPTTKPPAQAGGFPFAEPPPLGSYWPLGSTAPEGRSVSYLAEDGTYQGRHSREFMALRFNRLTKRKDRYHLGVDLFARRMDPVFACEQGRIVHFMPRFLYLAGKPNYTSALFVEHEHVTINYGEVHPESLQRTGLKVGDPVRAGQLLGFVGINPGGSSMLHFEVYRRGVKTNQRWAKNEPRPTHILNPVKYLLFLRDHGLAGAATNGHAPSSGSVAPPRPPANGGGGAHLDVDRAVRDNARWGERLGWMPSYDAVAYVLGFRNASPSQPLFAEAVATWQARNGLAADGVIGPMTWKKLQPLLASVPAFLRPQPGAPAAPSPAPATGGDAALEEELLARMRESWQRRGLTPPDRSTFRPYRWTRGRGWARYGGPYVDTTLGQLRARGLVDLRDEDVDMLQRASNVETGGRLNALNSWDSAVMSVGYLQWTLRYGELQQWIARAPDAFARYGIQLEPTRTYAFEANGKQDKQRAIVGAPYAKDLRSKAWGIRFFLAGLDADAVIASVPQALADAARVKKAYVLPHGAQVAAHYDASPEIRALVQEAHNNRPAYLKRAVAQAAGRARAAGAVSTPQFLELLRAELRDAYRKEDVQKAEHIIQRTAVRRLG